MTRRASFRQSDVERALRGVVASGMAVAELRIDQSGTIIVSCHREDAKKEARDASNVVAERLREMRKWAE
jgi:hypothetical protein